MKPSSGLRGLLVLFSLTWTCAGDWSDFPGDSSASD
uniref:Isoform 2 of Oocyte-secreted protein 1 n=1 Tax=Bos taurus TaxID=9913 RepID=Q2Q0J1-2|nr:oocyte-secreted protein variant 2 [Bos taurus]